jgi:hypothetical protein
LPFSLPSFTENKPLIQFLSPQYISLYGSALI